MALAPAACALTPMCNCYHCDATTREKQAYIMSLAQITKLWGNKCQRRTARREALAGTLMFHSCRPVGRSFASDCISIEVLSTVVGPPCRRNEVLNSTKRDVRNQSRCMHGPSQIKLKITRCPMFLVGLHALANTSICGCL